MTNTYLSDASTAFSQAGNFHPNDLSYTVYLEKYARWRDDLGRREVWPETVQRAVDYLRELVQDHGRPLDKATWMSLHQAILNMEVLPSMRLLSSAGASARRSNVAIYNCAYAPVDDTQTFVEALIISMCGTGFGYSVEDKYVAKLPIVVPQNGQLRAIHVIEDSAEGWATALRYGLDCWFSGYDIAYDYSRVRPAGSILRIKGGRASGPEPLRNLLEFTRSTILSRQGRRLTPLDAHDIMGNIALGAVSGGHRRSAMIALYSWDNQEMRHCKDGEFWNTAPWRTTANNSAVLDDGRISDLDIRGHFQAMVAGGNGEPGIFSRLAARSMRPSRRRDADFGTNPSLRAGTLVYTTDGIVPIETLEGKDFTVRNLRGENASATCWLSGNDKPLYAITLANGQTYHATAEHKWPVVQRSGSVKKVESINLKAGMFLPVVPQTSLEFGKDGYYEDGFFAGWLTGDGWITKRSDTSKTQIGLILSETDYVSPIRGRLESVIESHGSNAKFIRRERGECVWYELNTQNKQLTDYIDSLGVGGKDSGLPHDFLSTKSENFRKGFIDGLFSADGSVDKDGVTFVTKNAAFAEQIQTVLGFYGVTSHLQTRTSTGSFPNKKKYNKIYTATAVRFRSREAVGAFCNAFTLTHPEKQFKLNNFALQESSYKIRIVSVKLTDLVEDVWDVTVQDDTHCFQLAYSITGNCGEISLRPEEFCNLTEVILRPHDTRNSILRKTYLATLLGTIQSLATHFPGLRQSWTENCQEERLLGVGFTGQMDCPTFQNAQIMLDCQEYARLTNENFSQHFGIPQSASITCVKPSGSTSVLVDSASGLHTRWAPYYMKNVRLMATGPVAKMLLMNNFPMDPENGQSWDRYDTLVAHFPVKSPDFSVYRSDKSALEQCEYWKLVKLNLTEHNPSVTITYKPEEVQAVEDWVVENRGILGGMAFLPHFEEDVNLKQMPYVGLSQEQYQEAMAQIGPIDYSLITEFEKDDTTTSSQELACSAGTCEV